jgi:hypothetical protein
VSFIFADLIIIPIVRIHAKYYGRKMAVFLGISFFVAMAGAGYAIEALFTLLHLTPLVRNAKVLEASISWDYTTVLNLFFLAITGLLVWRFLRTGGPDMLRMMASSPDMHKTRLKSPGE